MAKPIFIVRLPSETEELERISKNLTDSLSDYYVLTISGNCDKAEFDVFYEKDMTDIKFDELKEYVTKIINKQ